MNSPTIREGRKEDLPRVLELIKELAEYERAPHEVINTVSMMEHDGFGPNPVFGFFVCENQNGIVGLSLYHLERPTPLPRRYYRYGK
jgi:hypothetical protein